MLKENEYLKWMTEKPPQQTFLEENEFEDSKKVVAEEWGFHSNFVFL